MRISDWSSDVCSSDLAAQAQSNAPAAQPPATQAPGATGGAVSDAKLQTFISAATEVQTISEKWQGKAASSASPEEGEEVRRQARSEERRVGKECVSTSRSRWSPSH